MISWLDEVFRGSGASLCFTKSDQTVFYQNALCRRLCGILVGKACPQTCVTNCEKIQGRSLETEGPVFFPNMRLGKDFFDILFFASVPYRMVLLYPLKRKYKTWAKRLRSHGLSPRELEIAQYCVQGLTNAAIASKLFISQATLKTHLNNIYKKMPEIRNPLWRRSPLSFIGNPASAVKEIISAAPALSAKA